jgi:putative endonuclease
MKDRKLMGDLGEEFAAAMLYSEGYTILERKFRCRLGEVDIICRRGRELDFVEVKARSSLDMGRPAEAVTQRKQMRIRGAARYYVMCHEMEDMDIRFQVFEILLNQIENAF